MNNNPFNITKAVDYSDEQIEKFWVDFPNSGFSDIIKPTSPMPMLILGGKGSGKTHIMRYFSYNLQKLRYTTLPIKGVEKDGYLGVYMRCSGLNSNRFSNKNQNPSIWKDLFSYYIELWLAQLLLKNIKEILSISNISDDIESNIFDSVLELFDETPSFVHSGKTINDIILILINLQKKIDIEVNNCSLSGSEISDLRILITPGKLIFGIPQLLSNKISEFSNIKFLYLIDEYENLLDYQQQYINTLLREKEDPTTFKIGARLYGLKTYTTYSADEEIKEGSEYEVYNIDQVFRDRENDYTEFIKNICLTRLRREGFRIDSFEHFETFFDTEKTILLSSDYERPYLNKLKDKLKKSKNQDINAIISNLSYNEDAIIERTNVFLFYREWNKGKKKLLDASSEIKLSCYEYIADKRKDTLHKKVLEKFKNDIIDQLYRELGIKIPYLGIDNYVKMSSGIPRHLLIMLKHIYRWSFFNGEEPFKEGSLISSNAQNKGIYDAISWFISDARIPGSEGNAVQNCMWRLGNFLRELRFSDIPPECSISTFSFNSSMALNKVTEIIDYLEQYSYLIKIEERRAKNSNRKDIVYQINGLIAPFWELSIHRRGVVSLKDNEVNTIFNLTPDDSDFNKVLRLRLNKYNYPFHEESPTLFN